MEEPTTQSRSLATLADQRKRVLAYLTHSYPLDDAAAAGSRGYSFGVELPVGADPHTWRPAEPDVWAPRFDKRQSDRRRSPRHVPRWEQDVCRFLDQQPIELHQLVPKALSQLDSITRTCVELHVRRGLTVRQIEDWDGGRLGISRMTIWRRVQDGIDQLCRSIWPDGGGAQWVAA